MKTAIIIPARYASTRLPAKALLRETGKYLVQHVYEQAVQVKGVEAVIVATDDSRIASAVESFGGQAVMTRIDHPSGTDRVAEVARGLSVDAILNLQGDEPLIDPVSLEQLIGLLRDDPKAEMATLAMPFTTLEAYQSPNCVKVVCGDRGCALYFSRSPIPHVRDGTPDFGRQPPMFLHHLGLYAYRREALLSFSGLSPHPLEQLEKLEQLRALGHGWTIRVGVIHHAGRGVDTPEDYQRFVTENRGDAPWIDDLIAIGNGPLSDSRYSDENSSHRRGDPSSMTKFIFVTGGVVSSLGKGLTCASIGMLLERRGLSVRLQKFDPYINVDPGTMSPYQHGEVYVLDDGAETDLDLGHYERFTNAPLSRDCNYTTGKIYLSVINKERKGDYKGRTVQVIPHITDEIKAGIKRLATPDVDVVITEIGGTVGDIEGMPFFEAIRQFALDVGKQNCLYIHLTLVPYLKAAGESKTKPTQHSVGELRKIGIQPDVLICRTERELPKDDAEKIAQFCNVERRAVIEERDKEYTIYEVPLSLVNNKLDDLVVEKLSLTKAHALEIDDWRDMVETMRNWDRDVNVTVVGKYVKHHDAYKSVYESLIHAGIANRCRVNIRKVEAEKVEQEGAEKTLSGADAILIPGGFDKRGVGGKLDAIQFAREHGVPFFGICLGLQCAAIEFARNVLNLPEANSTEFNPATPDPVVCLLDEQKKVTLVGGTMRLGRYECKVLPHTLAHKAYRADVVGERHRHRYEFNNEYRQLFHEAGMIVSGTTMDGSLVEVMELPEHPWFLGVQCHPEFQSKPTKAHPLFRDFVAAGLVHKAEKKADPGRSRGLAMAGVG